MAAGGICAGQSLLTDPRAALAVLAPRQRLPLRRAAAAAVGRQRCPAFALKSLLPPGSRAALRLVKFCWS